MKAARVQPASRIAVASAAPWTRSFGISRKYVRVLRG
jgi:hypothetical protein